MTDKIWKKYKEDHKDTSESFCGVCAVVPLAFAGVGASAYGSTSKGSHKKYKKIALWGGIVSILLSIFVIIYYLYFKKCSDCR